MSDAFEIEELKPSSAERKFEEFLKAHGLHVSQSPCGLGWVERTASKSGRYLHTVGLDIATPALRNVLLNYEGRRALFRFSVPQEITGNAPHLNTSDQSVYIPGVSFKLPKNPNLDLDISALLMVIKSQARRILEQQEVNASNAAITALMAIWFGRSDRRSIEYDHDFAQAKTEALHAEICDWIGASIPDYLTLLKFIYPEKMQGLTLDAALEARGISSHRLAVLYPQTAEA